MSLLQALFVVCCLANGIPASQISNSNAEVVKHVRQYSNPAVLPANHGPVMVNLGLSLINLREVDTIRGEVEMIAWLVQNWSDPRVSWNINSTGPTIGGSVSGGISGISISVDDVWHPDIAVYNSVSAPEILTPTLAHVSSQGNVVYVPGVRYRFHCSLAGFDGTEGANCTLKLGSWTHSVLQVDLAPPSPPDLSYYARDSRFELLGAYVRRNERRYWCCSEAYADVEFTFNIRKAGSGPRAFHWF